MYQSHTWKRLGVNRDTNMKKQYIFFTYFIVFIGLLWPQEQQQTPDGDGADFDSIKDIAQPPEEISSDSHGFHSEQFESHFGLGYESIFLGSLSRKNYYFSGIEINYSLYYWDEGFAPFATINGSYLLRLEQDSTDYTGYTYPYSFDLLLGVSSRMLLEFTTVTLLQVDVGLHLNGIYLNNPDYSDAQFKSLTFGYGFNFKLIDQASNFGIYVNPNFDFFDFAYAQRAMRYFFSINVGVLATL